MVFILKLADEIDTILVKMKREKHLIFPRPFYNERDVMEKRKIK